MNIEIIAAESIGVRGLCCLVTLPDRRIVIDPGIALGIMRHGLLPHPLQVAVGCSVREKMLRALETATDVVFSHFHGDHVPLLDANPYQLAFESLPPNFSELHGWCNSGDGLSARMSRRFQDLAGLMGAKLQIAEGRTTGPLSFSRAVPHGSAGSNTGTLMMTRIQMDRRVFVHASDIQLLDGPTVDRVIDWQPDIVFAAGPPLYLDRLGKAGRERAWANAMHLVQAVDTVILDHHLMRSEEGAVWLEELSAAAGRKVYCAADFMGRPRRLLEAARAQLYAEMQVPHGWHDDYARCRADTGGYFETMG